MEKIYDCLIIGSGPAGLTAAIYAARAGLDFAVIERSSVSGGQVLSTYEVDNYPGLPGRSGGELAGAMREHADRLGVRFLSCEVEKAEKLNDGGELLYKLTDSDGTELFTRTVVAATGAEHASLGCPGEEELAGMGVSYCATCDGAFFKDMPVAVIGGGDVALEDAIYLANICSKVYLIHRRDSFRAAAVLVNKARSLDNIEFVTDCVATRINGDDMVDSVDILNRVTGDRRTLSVNGVFIAVGIRPLSWIYADIAETDEAGYIKADETCRTSAPGFFAAGDIRTKALRQIITAAADGACAVTSVVKYLAE